MTPRWFWYVSATALIVIAAAAVILAVSGRENGRWVSEGGGALVLDTRTGTMCVVGGGSCFAAPVREAQAPGGRTQQPATIQNDTSSNPFDDPLAELASADSVDPYTFLSDTGSGPKAPVATVSPASNSIAGLPRPLAHLLVIAAVVLFAFVGRSAVGRGRGGPPQQNP